MIVSVSAWLRPWPESIPVTRIEIRLDVVGGVGNGVAWKSTELSLDSGPGSWTGGVASGPLSPTKIWVPASYAAQVTDPIQRWLIRTTPASTANTGAAFWRRSGTPVRGV